MNKQPDTSAALIIGASSGIGAELARQFSNSFDYLYLLARRGDRLEQVKQEIESTKAKATVIIQEADINKLDEFQSILKAICSEPIHLDLVIYNAGVARRKRRDEPQLEVYQSLMQTNFFGAVAAMDMVLPLLKSQKSGHVVFINSLAAYRGLPGSGAYVASKAALWKYAESLRCDLVGTPIKVSSIHPGYVRTEMTQDNKFKMPFLMSVQKAGSLIVRAIRKKKSHYSFPWAYRWFFYTLKFVPESIYPLIYRKYKRPE